MRTSKNSCPRQLTETMLGVSQGLALKNSHSIASGEVAEAPVSAKRDGMLMRS
jgi:hypothetical protein